MHYGNVCVIFNLKLNLRVDASFVEQLATLDYIFLHRYKQIWSHTCMVGLFLKWGQLRLGFFYWFFWNTALFGHFLPCLQLTGVWNLFHYSNKFQYFLYMFPKVNILGLPWCWCISKPYNCWMRWALQSKGKNTSFPTSIPANAINGISTLHLHKPHTSYLTQKCLS